MGGGSRRDDGRLRQRTGTAGPGPGEAGFVAGTVAAPRVVRVIAGPGYTFSPSTISVARARR